MKPKFLKYKIKEIKNSNISEPEKKEEIRKLLEKDKERELQNEKIQNKELLIELVLIALILLVFAIIGESGILENKMGANVFFCVVLVGVLVVFIYLGYRCIKEIQRKKCWESILKEEAVEFQKKCEELRDDAKYELKVKRNKIQINYIIFFISVMAPWCLLFYYLYASEAPQEYMMYIFLGVYSIIFVSWDNRMDKIKKEYVSLYKQKVISKFIKDVNDSMEYRENGKRKIANDYKYVGFDIADKNILRIDIEDYCSENINEYKMEMADIVAYEYFDIGRYKRGDTLFKGNFMVITTSKKYERVEVRLNKFKFLDSRKKINIGEEKFCKYFKVYAESNEIEECLSGSMIEFLSDFREKYDIDFEIIFEDKIYIKFYTNDIFEPKINRKAIDQYSIYKFFVLTKFAREIEKIL